MADYDFNILQPAEFEVFSRDILQAKEGLFVESFADGRDKGIDCRFAYANKRTAIVQCKRYATWASLKSTLKKEVPKVNTLNPNRYILTTSVDLTAANKAEIRQLFGKYVLSDTDIIGKADLNNLVSQNPNIERKHYKLWMSSTNILTSILHNDIIGWSKISLEQIRDELSKYVENDSFPIAVDIVKKNHFIVISGDPGIGKTTLARMLIIYFMEKEGYSNYTYITENLGEALKVADKSSKQVIFFDDFLGRNVLEDKGASFVRQLGMFANDTKGGDRILIVTTREYIFQEAKYKYDRTIFRNIEGQKYILRMGDYSVGIRSKIIYNHFAAAELPTAYAMKLREGRHYYDLARHKNFNPRLIETIVNERLWDYCKPEEFYIKVKSFFDNPEAVWDEAFENLKNEARYSLYVLTSMPTPVLLEDWKQAYFHFQNNTTAEIDLKAEEDSWLNLVKTLEQCFISIKVSNQQHIVELANPSVFDYLANHLKSRPIICSLLISYPYYYEQLHHLFTDKKSNNYYSRIEVSTGLYEKIIEAFRITAIQKHSVCRLRRCDEKNLKKSDFSIIEAYSNFLQSYSKVNAYFGYFVENTIDFETIIDGRNINDNLSLLEQLNLSYCRFDVHEALEVLGSAIRYAGEAYEYISTVKKLGFNDLIDDPFFHSQLHDIVKGEVETTGDYQNCEELIDIVQSISKELEGWDGEDYCKTLSKKQDELMDGFDEEAYKEMKYQFREAGEMLDCMDEMFDCLCAPL